MKILNFIVTRPFERTKRSTHLKKKKKVLSIESKKLQYPTTCTHTTAGPPLRSALLELGGPNLPEPLPQHQNTPATAIQCDTHLVLSTQYKDGRFEEKGGKPETWFSFTCQ